MYGWFRRRKRFNGGNEENKDNEEEESNDDYPNFCTKQHDQTKYPDLCCHFKAGDDECCRTIPYSSYYTGYNFEYINNKLYKVDCGNTKLETFALQQCGNSFEDGSLKKCKQYSTFVDSCCYFKGDYEDNIAEEAKQLKEKKCYWLGSKYNGKITWAGAKLECNHNYLNYSLFYLFSFAFSIIILF